MLSKVEKSSVLPGGTLLLCVCKGAAAAFGVSLAGVILFALALTFLRIEETTIGVVNQVLRILSIVVGVYVALRKKPQRGWLKGMLCGLLYTVFTYIIFSAIDGSWYIGLPLLWDVLLAMLSGAAAGVLLVNLRKK